MNVVASADGQPRVLIMPTFGWSSHCGKWTCFHPQCLKARERLRRCHLCQQHIRAGQRYIEERDDKGQLIMQAHEACAVKESS